MLQLDYRDRIIDNIDIKKIKFFCNKILELPLLKYYLFLPFKSGKYKIFKGNGIIYEDVYS